MRTVSLVVRDIPRPVFEQLKLRAARRRRSLQAEALAILEAAAAQAEPRRTVAETLQYVRELGVRTPSESTTMIHADRER